MCPYTLRLPFVLVLLVLILNPARGWAQRYYLLPDAARSRGSLVANGHAWTVGNPEMIVAGDVTSVLPSPDYRHLLLVREIHPLTAETKGQSQNAASSEEIDIIWWNVRTHRSTVVWQQETGGSEFMPLRLYGWLGRTGTAIFRIARGSTTSALFVKAATGEVHEVVIPPDDYNFLSPSPTQPYIALYGADASCDSEIWFMQGNGRIAEPITLPTHLYFTRWTEDGKRLLGSDAMEKWYAVDPEKRTVSPIDKPKTTTDDVYEPLPDPADILPVRLVGEASEGKTPGSSHAVLLEAFPKTTEHIVVSTEGEPLFLFPDGSGALFRRDGALYFAPLVVSQ